MKARRKLRASNLHSDNMDDLLREENDTSLLNHQEFGDLLIDPDENTAFKSMRDTHGIFASRRIRADLDDDILDDDLLEDMPEDGLSAIESDFDDVEIDDLDLDMDDDGLDPTEVLSDTDVLPDQVDEQKTVDIDEALDKTEDKENNTSDVQRQGEAQDQAVEASDSEKKESEDKDEKDEKKDDDKDEKSESESDSDKEKVESAKKKVKADEVELQNNQSDGKIEVDSAFDLVDVDCIDDKDCEDLVFASINGTKHVIKSNRIIASLTADEATINEIADVYLDDDFDEAVVSECEAKGLRAGLRAMGFALAKVNIKPNAHVNASVEKAKAELKATFAKQQDARKDVMQQCLALAAVGLNRNMFKGYENTLRSELTAKFESLGVRGASRIVKAAFTDYGVDYAKKLLVIANEVADLPEETRDGLAAQLDMTNEPDDEIMADPNLYGDPVTGEGEDGEDDSVESIEAALRNPIKALATKHQVKASVNKPLPFAIY